MNPQMVEQAARLLLDARRNAYQVDELPPEYRPESLSDAYQVQARLVELLGSEYVGWFLGGTNGSPVIPVPYATPILKGQLVDSPARLTKAQFLTWDVDVEFGFTIQVHEAGNRSWTREAVRDAVLSVHPTLDIVNSHYTDLDVVGWPSIIADNGTDGLVVRGIGVEDWRGFDFPSMNASLFVNGSHVASGTGSVVMGDPLDALVWAIRHLEERGHPVRSGDFITTGSCTPPYRGSEGDEIVAEFDGLGSVTARLTT